MHRFHPPRGRVAFEVLCAFVAAASCAGVWAQTGATAALPGAAAAALYGLVHLFDLKQPAEARQPQRIDFATEEPEVPLDPAAAPQEAVPEMVFEVVPDVVSEPGLEPLKATRKARASRKVSARGAKAAKNGNVSEVAPLTHDHDAKIDPVCDSVAEFAAPAFDVQSHIEPLFEPEPFARMPRRAFGRKAG